MTAARVRKGQSFMKLSELIEDALHDFGEDKYIAPARPLNTPMENQESNVAATPQTPKPPTFEMNEYVKSYGDPSDPKIRTHIGMPGGDMTICGLDAVGDDLVHAKPPEDCQTIIAAVKDHILANAAGQKSLAGTAAPKTR